MPSGRIDERKRNLIERFSKHCWCPYYVAISSRNQNVPLIKRESQSAAASLEKHRGGVGALWAKCLIFQPDVFLQRAFQCRASGRGEDGHFCGLFLIGEPLRLLLKEI